MRGGAPPSPAPSRRARESPAPEGKGEGGESFWEKVGTLGRKKKVIFLRHLFKYKQSSLTFEQNINEPKITHILC